MANLLSYCPPFSLPMSTGISCILCHHVALVSASANSRGEHSLFLNLFILFSALLEGKPQKNSYCSNKISGDAITWLPKLQVRVNNYFAARLRLNAGHTLHPAKIPAPLASSGSSQMLNSAPEWGAAVSVTHGKEVIRIS